MVFDSTIKSLAFLFLYQPFVFALLNAYVAKSDYIEFSWPANFSWIEEGKIAGMAIPKDQRDIDLLKKNNFGLILSLTQKPLKEENLNCDGIEVFHLPIDDFSIPQTYQQIDNFFNTADKVIQEGKAVLVHCFEGMGRTGTILACWLGKQRGISGEHAIKELRKIRPHSIETESQEKFVTTYLKRHQEKTQNLGSYEWGVIGAGPAGIIAVGGLLDKEVSEEKIIQFDPKFRVGKMGKYYGEIFSNTLVQDYIAAFRSLNSFREIDTSDEIRKIMHYGLHNGCHLKYITASLQKVSDYFKKKIKTIKNEVEHVLWMEKENCWHLYTDDETYYKVKKVILAIGSHPRSFDFEPQKSVSLFDIINTKKRIQLIQPNDIVAVFGSSHSAVLTIKLLLEQRVKKVINFYRSKIRDIQSFHSYNASQGIAEKLSVWAEKNIVNDPPENFIRVFNSAKNRATYKDEITKVVYAIGFEREPISLNENNQEIKFDDRTGILGSNLYGLGVAFPQGFIDHNGIHQRKVEIPHFIHYLKNVLPLWMAHGKNVKS